MSIEGQLFTAGEFQTEEDALAAFDLIVESNAAFSLFREVEGEYLQPRPLTGTAGARVDRLLIPRDKAIEAGWREGAIAVEGKCSEKKLGRLVCQGLDYSRCVWRLREKVPGLLVMTSWTFLFPCDNTHGDIGSVMANNRIGFCRLWRNELNLGSSSTNFIRLLETGEITVRSPMCGNKRGSR